MVTQNNTATAEESAAACEELSGQAETLKAMAGKFVLETEKPAGRLDQIVFDGENGKLSPVF